MRRALAGVALGAAPLGAQVVYRSPAFFVTDTSVRQGRFEAVATSRDTIRSSYPRAAREVHFKFALNGQDDEFPPGIEHTINVRPRGGTIVTPVYVFGVEPAPALPTPEQAGEGEEGTARVTIRLDLRHVLRALREQGHYDPPRGPRITRLERVHVIGDTDPLTWDVARARTELTDRDGDGIYETTLPFPAAYARPLGRDGRALWARRLDLAGFPTLESPQRLHDALYRLSLEELRELVRPDGALSAGAKWPGVWTRDVSLASVLSLALIAPDAVRASLLAKVDSTGRIIQDTGTGGSWPVSTDRTTWALAAWELYAATGDRAWLRQAYDVVARSAEADLHAARDPGTGLFRGESSFLDWREQSYPRWMQPADIYQGTALGTNAVHLGTYRVLGDMARALGEPAARWDATAASLRRAIDARLWQPALGRHAQFRYGRVAMSTSPRFEALGEALAVLNGAASPAQRERAVRGAPLVPFGVPTFWPYIGGVPFYHNATIWPFVTAYWTWAAAEAGNGAAVEHGLATMTRATALFLTNKENMVAATGHFEGTALNSDRQLWSVAGTLAMTYRVLFGLRPGADALAFRPMVPPAYTGTRTLRGLRWRGAMLDVTVRGHGARVARATLDGRPLPRAELPASLAGAHAVVLELDGRWPAGGITLADNLVAPATPRAALRGDTLTWDAVPGALHYELFRDGRRVGTEMARARRVPLGRTLAEWQVQARDARGLASFLSEPVRAIAPGAELVVRPDGAPLRLTGEPVRITVQVPRAGRYAIDARYANGNGPVNTEDKVGVRTLVVGRDTVGVLVFPQRGVNAWQELGWSNPLVVRLAAGSHVLSLVYDPRDANMNRRVNEAILDAVRLTPLP